MCATNVYVDLCLQMSTPLQIQIHSYLLIVSLRTGVGVNTQMSRAVVGNEGQLYSFIYISLRRAAI